AAWSRYCARGRSAKHRAGETSSLIEEGPQSLTRLFVSCCRICTYPGIAHRTDGAELHLADIMEVIANPFLNAQETAATESHWYAAYTASRHEKTVAEHLRQRNVECFLPLYESVRRWNNGRHRVQLPLFPSYIFVRMALRDKLRVLQVPGLA